MNGGERGIRTLETVPRLHTFQACAFDHSATSPHIRLTGKYPAMPPAVKAVALARFPMATHQKSPVRIGRHYSQDALLGNRYLAVAPTFLPGRMPAQANLPLHEGFEASMSRVWAVPPVRSADPAGCPSGG
jgi:hypothetical protein